MKLYPFLAVALLFILSGWKEPGILRKQTNDHYLENVQQALKDSLKSYNYRELDFLKAVLTRNESLNLYVLSIPFSKDHSQYVILKTNKSGVNESGKIVHFASCSPAAEISWSTWISLMRLFHTVPPIYTSFERAAGESDIYSVSAGGSGGSTTIDPDNPGTINNFLVIDFENQVNNPAITLEQYIRCFSAVSDIGATCSIEIFCDIPVNGRPDIFFNVDTGSPGHTFIQLRKHNVSQSISQNIGFYFFGSNSPRDYF